MFTVGAAGVGGGEDSCQAAVLCHERAPEMARRHVLEHLVERRMVVNHVRVGQVHVANEQLGLGRQSEVGVECTLEVPIGQDSNSTVCLPR